MFYDGRRPARRPLPVLVGSPDCIANGEKEGLAVINNVSAACSPILPGPCYAPLSEIHAKTDVQDCVFAKASADIIDLAYTDLLTAEAAATAYLGDDSTVTTFEQPTPLIPAGVIAIKEDTCVLWLTGTSTPEQLATQALYSGFGPISFGPYSAAGLYQAAALLVADQLNAAGVADCPRVILCGHSYGGAVCEVLTAIMLLADEDRDVHLLTLGAPQPGDRRLFNLIRFVDQRHYANQRDPVPYLPPRGSNFQELLPVIGVGLGSMWTEFHRPPNTTVILEDGTLMEMREEDFPNDLITAASTLIAQALQMPKFKDHSTAWYAYRLCLGCACVAKPCIPPPVNDMVFEMFLEDMDYVFDALPGTANLGPLDLAVTARFPNDQPSAWSASVPGVGLFSILAAAQEFDEYTEFVVHYEPDPVDPVWACDWEFTAAEMFAVIETTDFPDTFGLKEVGDGVVSLGRLKIVPTHV